MFGKLLNGLCDLVYPRNCLVCKKYITSDKKGQALCASCLGLIEPNHPPFCLKCSRHLASDLGQSYCQECRHDKHHFDSAWAAVIYNDAMKKLLHLFKYGDRTALADTFAELTFSFVENYHIDICRFDLVIPIPLHPTRLRERGYNQSQLLSQRLSGKFNLQQNEKILKRIVHTKNQALLGKKERWTNIHGAFRINDQFPVFKKSVLVVDDLLTTGATISEVAKVLKEAGAKEVCGLTLAVALQDG
ncbi:MAG TPA: ComF family protein [Candidatus Omnitrophota bacterium]|nr:ComF family protein [Candidatus Omnitrophota bacterium]HPD84803.1 ComF family protein [Candidatus Omnitrophota bacterium]HRZ03661.1 ComF family protein [Candidatus Omnitrophota bacterium]